MLYQLSKSKWKIILPFRKSFWDFAAFFSHAEMGERMEG